MLAANRLGAERIIALSRNPARQALARTVGATDIIEARGDEANALVLELTADIGVDAAMECVGTQQSMTTAVTMARPGPAPPLHPRSRPRLRRCRVWFRPEVAGTGDVRHGPIRRRSRGVSSRRTTQRRRRPSKPEREGGGAESSTPRQVVWSAVSSGGSPSSASSSPSLSSSFELLVSSTPSRPPHTSLTFPTSASPAGPSMTRRWAPPRRAASISPPAIAAPTTRSGRSAAAPPGPRVNDQQHPAERAGRHVVTSRPVASITTNPASRPVAPGPVTSVRRCSMPLPMVHST